MNNLIFYFIAAIFIYFIVMKVNMGCSGCMNDDKDNNGNPITSDSITNASLSRNWSTNNITPVIIPPFEGPVITPYPQFSLSIPPSDLTNQYGQNENPFEFRQVEGVTLCYD